MLLRETEMVTLLLHTFIYLFFILMDHKSQSLSIARYQFKLCFPALNENCLTILVAPVMD